MKHTAEELLHIVIKDNYVGYLLKPATRDLIEAYIDEMIKNKRIIELEKEISNLNNKIKEIFPPSCNLHNNKPCKYIKCPKNTHYQFNLK